MCQFSALFDRAILQSGSYLNYRTIMKSGESRKQAWKFASVVGCDKPYIKTSEDLTNCLRMIPAQILTTSVFFMMVIIYVPKLIEKILRFYLSAKNFSIVDM